MSLLHAEKLYKSYQKRPVVQEFSLTVQPGEVVGLLGPNGAGKSTAFYLLAGLLRPDQGKVFFNDQPVTHLPMDERALLGIGYLAQEPCVFSTLTVAENLLIVLETLPLSAQEQKKRLKELLEELHLSELAHKRAATLSGGERRRLELTRVLATNPLCLLLDEPFANIDPRSIEEVQALIGFLSRKGISVLITDHNAREIFSITDRCYLMQAGRILCEGSPTELVENQQARDFYLGRDFKY